MKIIATCSTLEEICLLLFPRPASRGSALFTILWSEESEKMGGGGRKEKLGGTLVETVDEPLQRVQAPRSG